MWQKEIEYKTVDNMFGFFQCEFKSKCEGFSTGSVTCASGADKTYCGIFRQFKNEGITEWKKDN